VTGPRTCGVVNNHSLLAEVSLSQSSQNLSEEFAEAARQLKERSSKNPIWQNWCQHTNM